MVDWDMYVWAWFWVFVFTFGLKAWMGVWAFMRGRLRGVGNLDIVAAVDFGRCMQDTFMR